MTSVAFNGSSAQITCGAAAAVTDDMTVEIRMRYSSANSTFARALSRLEAGGNGLNVAFNSGNSATSKMVFRVKVGATTYVFGTNQTVARDADFTFTATKAGTALAAYIDGEASTLDGSIGGGVVGDATFRIGSSNGNWFGGLISEIRIWNVIRTQEEVAEWHDKRIPAGTPGLVHLWRLDEGEGATAFDSVGENDGALSNATWSETDLGLIVPLRFYGTVRDKAGALAVGRAVRVILEHDQACVASLTSDVNGAYGFAVVATAFGTVTTASASIITDSAQAWTVDEFATHYGVRMTSGAQSGQWRRIASNTATALTLASDLPGTTAIDDTFEIAALHTLVFSGESDRNALVYSGLMPKDSA